jgi:hypothetical protein
MHHFWFSKESSREHQHHKALGFSGYEGRILSSPQTDLQLYLAADLGEKHREPPARLVWLGHSQTSGD